MVKNDKKNKREYERKVRAEGGRDQPPPPEKTQKAARPASGGVVPAAQPPVPPSSFTGVKEDATKLIQEANQRFLEAKKKEEEEAAEAARWKRNITSNWTRYEIPEEEEAGEEEEDALTGQEWSFALSAATSADSHLKMKGEEGWDLTGGTGLSEEFFNLDLAALEKSLLCIPLHQQIGLDEKCIDPESLELFYRKARRNKESQGGGGAATEELAGRMMNILTLPHKEEPGASKSIAVEDTTKTTLGSMALDIVVDEEKHENKKPPSSAEIGVGAELNFARPPELLDARPQPVGGLAEPADVLPPQQQRERRRDRRRKEEIVLSEEETAPRPTETPPTVAAASDPPLEQRVRRKEHQNPSVPSGATPAEQEDLAFMESLERNESSSAGVVAAPAGAGAAAPVVPVQIVAVSDRKELEDWLEDFLAD